MDITYLQKYKESHLIRINKTAYYNIKCIKHCQISLQTVCNSLVVGLGTFSTEPVHAHWDFVFVYGTPIVTHTLEKFLEHIQKNENSKSMLIL